MGKFDVLQTSKVKVIGGWRGGRVCFECSGTRCSQHWSTECSTSREDMLCTESRKNWGLSRTFSTSDAGSTRPYLWGPSPLHPTRQHGHLLKSTCNMTLIDIRKDIGVKTCTFPKIRHYNIGKSIFKLQKKRQVTLPFLKTDMRHWGPPSRAPPLPYLCSVCLL